MGKTLKLSTAETRDEVSKILRAVVSICDQNKITYYCEAGTVLGAVRHAGPIPWDYDADIVVPNNELDYFVECCARFLPDEYWIDYHTLPTGGYNEFPRIGKKGYSTEHLHLDAFRLIGLPDAEEEQLDILKRTAYFGRLWDAFDHKLLDLAKRIYHLEINEFFTRLNMELKGDITFLKEMDELCALYPYESSEYVLNPHGIYGVKSIFNKSVYGKGLLMPYLDFFVRVPSETDYYLNRYYGDYMEFPPQEKIDMLMNSMHTICVKK